MNDAARGGAVPQTFHTGVHTSQRHDSAHKHVTGSADYVDDIPEQEGTLHAALILADAAHARIVSIDSAAARAMPGVIDILFAADIPGQNDISPIYPGEPLFAEKLIEHHGQPLGVVVARTLDEARAAAKRVAVAIEPLEPVLTIEEALERKSFHRTPMTVQRGDAGAALARAPHRLRATLRIGGQEHFYLEGQIALALPGEDGEFLVHSSTQNPTEVQHICARLLGIAFNKVTARVRRMGGGFGGKESNASWIAGAAALCAARAGRPVKLRLPREVDMLATGKRHAFLGNYEAGFDADGRLLAYDVTLASLGGHSVDHSVGVMTRAVCHAENCYWIADFRATGIVCKTNTVSNTAFRGYGTPQGVAVIEDAIERIARALGKTPEEVRAVNFYREGHDTTPYGQRITDNRIHQCVDQVMRDSGWNARRAEIDRFNRASRVIKRGLGMLPLKFGMSFNSVHLNQAGALVSVYTDGTIRLAHGGTEMGQGLFVKVAQIVAEVFQVNLDRIAYAPTSTGEVPNTPPTAASVSSDINGWAAHDAAMKIRRRMSAFAAEKFGVPDDAVSFADNHVSIGRGDAARRITFGELAKLCFFGRVSLSATGFYCTPDLSWDPVTMKGSPFFYFAYGAAAVEVAIDTLTGETRVLRADLVQDCGRSINPAIDTGQIEGAFAQGLGWLTMEELWWDDQGRLRTVGPSTYKIPGSRDMPPDLRVHLLEDAPAQMNTIFRSKGIGEPPLMLALAILPAIRDAVGSLCDRAVPVALDAPATPERVLFVVDAARAHAARRAGTHTGANNFDRTAI